MYSSGNNLKNKLEETVVRRFHRLSKIKQWKVKMLDIHLGKETIIDNFKKICVPEGTRTSPR